MEKKNFIEEHNFIIRVDGREWHVNMQLCESGAFQYGNGTCVVVTQTCEGKESMPDLYDTRYEIGIKNDFLGWCEDFLKNNSRKGATIERA